MEKIIIITLGKSKIYIVYNTSTSPTSHVAALDIRVLDNLKVPMNMLISAVNNGIKNAIITAVTIIPVIL